MTLSTSTPFPLRQVAALLALVLLLLVPAAHAQTQGFMQQNSDRIESMRVAFITRYVNLTPEESQKFWPVYNEYLRETDAANRDQLLLKAEARIKANQMTDAEIEGILNQMIEMEKKDVAIQEKYLEKFKQILPIRKVALLYPAEREFRRELIRSLRGR